MGAGTKINEGAEEGGEFTNTGTHGRCLIGSPLTAFLSSERCWLSGCECGDRGREMPEGLMCLFCSQTQTRITAPKKKKESHDGGALISLRWGLTAAADMKGLCWGTRQYFQYFQGVWLLLDLMCARPVLCPLSHISGHRGVYGVCLLLLLGHT